METIRIELFAKALSTYNEQPSTQEQQASLTQKKGHASPILLDLGCGEGRHVHAAAWQLPQAHVVGIDIAYDDVKTAKEKGDDFFGSIQHNCITNYSCANGMRLPFADNSIDAIICSEVLEHVPNYTTILGEITRILKPGGTLGVSVPRAWPERICWLLSKAYHQVEGGHIRIFSARALRNTIQSYGFEQTAHYYAHALHSPYWWLRCLFWRWGEKAWPCQLYHKLLVWDLMQKPWLTQTLEKIFNPIMGKSVVWHFKKT